MITHIIPYLTFGDNCEEAVNFYVKVLGGEIKSLLRVKDGPEESRMPGHEDKVMHAEVMLGEALIMASDAMGQNVSAGNNTAISMNFDSETAIVKAWEGMTDGANVTMELQDTFWGAKFGVLQDRFGINWMFNYDKK
jgi:PhnB protein